MPEIDQERLHRLRRAGWGALRIADERYSQIHDHGCDPHMDDIYIEGELVRAALSYLIWSHTPPGTAPPHWPWTWWAWKPSEDRVHDLEKCGALIAAEIDRLLRERGQEEAS